MAEKLRVMLVAGARPNFVKVAPLLFALRQAGHACQLVHTGQHYDAGMSDVFFLDLGIPTPDFHLGVGSGTHAQQTARVMQAFEPVLIAERPEWLVVVGDVNSTLACALVGAKLRPELGCRIAHVEAGLRSNDWRMPEEVNRVLTDRLSDLLLTPSSDAHANLVREGIDARRIRFVGNVMIDSLFRSLPAARKRDLPGRLRLSSGGYVLVTLHRPSNVDDAASLSGILQALAHLAETMPVVFPIHPRTRKNAEVFGLGAELSALRTLDPLGYVDMLSLTERAAVCVTDSGGLQEETTVLGVPCVTLREQTERPLTIECGTNRLAPWPLTRDGILRTVEDARRHGRVGIGSRAPEGWDGEAAVRVRQALEGTALPDDSLTESGEPRAAAPRRL